MHVLFLLYIVILFVMFSPDVLFRFPVKGSKTAVVFVHAGIFFAVLYFSNIFIYPAEGFIEGGLFGIPSCRTISGPCSPVAPSCSPPTYVCNDRRVCPAPGWCINTQQCNMQPGACAPSPPSCQPDRVICN
jgi:hypothetical protein